MENVRKHVDVKLCVNEKKFSKLVNDCRYVSSRVIEEDFVSMERKEKIYFWINLSILVWVF